jgi:hypothetical protein
MSTFFDQNIYVTKYIICCVQKKGGATIIDSCSFYNVFSIIPTPTIFYDIIESCVIGD